MVIPPTARYWTPARSALFCGCPSTFLMVGKGAAQLSFYWGLGFLHRTREPTTCPERDQKNGKSMMSKYHVEPASWSRALYRHGSVDCAETQLCQPSTSSSTPHRESLRFDRARWATALGLSQTPDNTYTVQCVTYPRAGCDPSNLCSILTRYRKRCVQDVCIELPIEPPVAPLLKIGDASL